MTPIDWTSVALGWMVGAVSSALFFAGLGFGMQIALRSARPIASLAISAFVRMASLLGVGWLVFALDGLWSATGYVLAFMVVRFIATTFARSGVSIGSPS